MRDLDMSLGTAEGTAGTTYRALVFTNIADRHCTIGGIPRVLLVAGPDHEPVGAEATPVGAAGPAVTVKPGTAATAPVGFVNVGNFDPEACQPIEASGLLVYPPGGQENEFVPFDTTTCGAENFPTMTIRTVHPGTSLT